MKNISIILYKAGACLNLRPTQCMAAALLVCSVTVAQNEASAIAKCRAIAIQLEKPFNESTAKAIKVISNPLPNQIEKWRVHSGELMFVLEHPSQNLVGFVDLKIQSELSRLNWEPATQISDSRVSAIFESIRSYFNLSELSEIRINRSNAVPHSSRGQFGVITASGHANAYGFATAGFGNSVSVTVDARDGRIVQLMLSRGWRYDPPNVRITSEFAEAIARSAGTEQELSKVELRYVVPNARFQSTGGATFRNERRLRLGYVFSFDSEVLFVDAETGALLGGGRTATGALKKRSVTPVKQARPLVLLSRSPLFKTVQSMLLRVKLPLSAWDTAHVENRGKESVVFLNKAGFDTSELNITGNRIRIAVINAKMPPKPAKALRTAQDVRSLYETCFGPIPRTAKVTAEFRELQKVHSRKWLKTGKIARILVKESAARGKNVEFASYSGQLLDFTCWP